jgi:hypothetical protein
LINNTSGNTYDYSVAAMGVALNRVPLFSGFAAPGDNILDEAYTFDGHQGHPTNASFYQYHRWGSGPLEVLKKKGYNTSTTPGSPSASGVELYGITCDGVIVFGASELDGSTPIGTLDAQGGHIHDISDKSGVKHFTGRYHVHISPNKVGTNTSIHNFVPELKYYSVCSSSGS